jgi:hypothetical protein
MQPYSLPHKQQGAVLLIGMIMLVILMLGATSLMNSTVMDERLAGNSKASAEAFYAAETGYLQALEHLEPEDADNPGELDLALAKGRWMELEDQLKEFDTLEKWNNRNSQPKVPAALVKADNSKHEFTLSIAPVFEQTVDADGVTKTVRAEHKVQFASNGTFGTAERTIGFNLDGGGLFGGGGTKAPAAISCFGACNITSGAGNKAVISGQNHPLPNDLNCSGNSSSCNVPAYSKLDNNDESKPHFSVPSVFLDNKGESQLGSQGNSGRISFVGQDSSKSDREDADQHVASGGDSDANSVWVPENFPMSEENPKESTAPVKDDFFGNSDDALLADLIKNAGDKTSSVGKGTATIVDTNKYSDLFKVPREDSPGDKGYTSNLGGVLIIDGGGQLKMAGGSFYAGLIVVRGCSQISSRGNFNIFGAVIVDAHDADGKECGKDYHPFEAKGTPSVKYSQDALDRAGFGTGNNTGLGVTDDWYEIVGQ